MGLSKADGIANPVPEWIVVGLQNDNTPDGYPLHTLNPLGALLIMCALVVLPMKLPSTGISPCIMINENPRVVNYSL